MEAVAAVIALTAMEIVLGIDNIVFITAVATLMTYALYIEDQAQNSVAAAGSVCVRSFCSVT